MGDIFDQIRKARHECLRTMDMPDEVKMSHDAYTVLRASPQVAETHYATGLPDSIFGMRVIVDPALKPGEWKLVTPQMRRRDSDTRA